MTETEQQNRYEEVVKEFSILSKTFAYMLFSALPAFFLLVAPEYLGEGAETRRIAAIAGDNVLVPSYMILLVLSATFILSYVLEVDPIGYVSGEAPDGMKTLLKMFAGIFDIGIPVAGIIFITHGISSLGALGEGEYGIEELAFLGSVSSMVLFLTLSLVIFPRMTDIIRIMDGDTE